MEFSKLQQRAIAIREEYRKLEQARYGKEWTDEDLTMGFVGDVGDLVKLVMAKQGVRRIENVEEKLSHELADCLWSVLVLADSFGVDIETEFMKTMDQLEHRVAQDLG